MRLAIAAVGLAAALSWAVPAQAAGPIGIVAAENFYGTLAAAIGGSHVAVTSILSNPDDDPHLFETSASTARQIADAQIVLYNGAGYDPWMDKLLSASPSTGRSVIVAAQLLGRESADNPHLWYDPPTFPAVAKALATELEKRDPADAADFKANLGTFVASLAPVGAAIARLKAAHAGTEVTATEPVFGYMAAALGLKMLNPEFQLAIMNDTEPSPSQVARFQESLKSGKAKMLIYNSQVTDDTTTRLLDIAKTAGVPVVGVTETAPANKSIADWLLGQLGAVEDALK
ncbi:MAG: zinc ABC transporter substrate-binding protein [Devosia sp.]|nr:zinc ABC transporter substrate-binding protein [Devosia sp.]